MTLREFLLLFKLPLRYPAYFFLGILLVSISFSSCPHHSVEAVIVIYPGNVPTYEVTKKPSLSPSLPGNFLSVKKQKGFSKLGTPLSISVQDGDDGKMRISPDSTSLNLWGNAWKEFYFEYKVTPWTVVELDFADIVEGEIHAFGFIEERESLPSLYSLRSFQLAGSQIWGIQNIYPWHTDTESNFNFRHYQIRLGNYYNGNMKYLFFVNDADIKVRAQSVFRNIFIYEDAPPTPPDPVKRETLEPTFSPTSSPSLINLSQKPTVVPTAYPAFRVKVPTFSPMLRKPSASPTDLSQKRTVIPTAYPIFNPTTHAGKIQTSEPTLTETSQETSAAASAPPSNLLLEHIAGHTAHHVEANETEPTLAPKPTPDSKKTPALPINPLQRNDAGPTEAFDSSPEQVSSQMGKSENNGNDPTHFISMNTVLLSVNFLLLLVVLVLVRVLYRKRKLNETYQSFDQSSSDEQSSGYLE